MDLLPNFLIVGAAKSGTTSLFNYLKQYPQVFIPSIKECRFFSQMPRNFKGGQAAVFQNQGPRSIDEYLYLFQKDRQKTKGDISNDYFYYYRKSINNIKSTYMKLNQPEPKIIILLRNPVDRVFSMYHHIIRLGSDNIKFLQAFKLSQKRLDDGYAWMYDLEGVGKSYAATREYLNNFKSVKIILTEDLSDPDMCYEILNFLGVDGSSNFKSNIDKKYNRI